MDNGSGSAPTVVESGEFYAMAGLPRTPEARRASRVFVVSISGRF